MNLILLEPDDFVGEPGRVRIEGRRFRYIRDVHRAVVGDELCVGRLGGLLGSGKLIAMDDQSAHMEVQLSEPPPDPLPVTLILALPRPLVLKRVLISATSMGVKRIILVNPRRVDRSFWSSSVLRPEAIRAQLLLGLEQARDTRLPEVLLRPGFRTFIEEDLPGLVEGSEALIAHPEAGGECPRFEGRDVTLAVGPEGGFSDYEVDAFEASGFRRVSLGTRALRVETAVPVLLAKLFA